MIFKSAGAGSSEQTPIDGEENIEVILPSDDGELELPEDLSAEAIEGEFYSNLAEAIGKKVLASIADECDELYENDLNSRSDWEKTYEEGIKLLGLGIEERTEPWDGACGVVHPLMAEAAIKFQAEAITSTFSAQGVCKTQILGKLDDIRMKSAKRVENDINWRLTTQMKEYRPEHERMLWNLAIMGSAFKKVYFDPSLGRQTSVFVSAEDLVAPYGSTDISTLPRLAHRMRKSPNDVKKLQVAGFYRDIELPEPTKSSRQSAKDKITGISAIDDDRHELIEMHLDLNIEGYEDVDVEGNETGIMLPYVVTFDLQSKEVLSIYRNWRIDDENKTRTQHFVHYIYIPGFGFYGMGLVHLVGGFANSATSLLRQLVDAGTLANLPAGFKTKGIRVQRDSDPLQPGEFRDVDVPSGSLRDNLIPLPFKEPSQTLLALFNEIVEEGRRMAAVSDVNAADMNQEAPVGTTLAILERSMKVMSAIQARLHASLKEELSIIKSIVKDQAGDEYDYDVDEGRQVKRDDYAIVDILPVSDPNAATMSQRVVQYQAVSQMAAANPAIYDRVELDKQMLEVLGIKNIEKIIPSSGEQTPKDPITENMNIIMGKPVKAFAYQDHEAHLKAHLAAQQDPKIMKLVGQSPNAQTIGAAATAHINEHVAHEYRKRIEERLGAPLPQGDEKMSPEVEKQLSVVMAQAAQQLLQQHQTEAAQQAAADAAKDPIVQQQQKQLENDAEKNRISEKKVDGDHKLGAMKILADAGKLDKTLEHDLQMQANEMLANAAEFDANQAAAGKSPEAHQQELAQKYEAHQLSLEQQRQQLAHAGDQHGQKLDQQDEAHKQKMQRAEEQRMLAAAVNAAKPHMGKDKQEAK